MDKWNMVKLSDVFTLQMGKTPSRNNPDYWNGNHKWLSIADFGMNGKYINKTKECITDAAVAESGIKATPHNTVVMSFKLSIGKTAITVKDIFTNEAIMSFIDKGTYPIDVNYIYHLFSGKDWSKGTNKAVMGTTLNKATLSQTTIPLPPIESQYQIADNLEKVSKLIDICNTILNKLDILVKSRFVEMFGNPITNSHNLPLKTLSELGELGRGISKHRPRNAPELLGGVYPLIQTGDVANASLYIIEYNSTYSEIGYKQSKMWNKGTLCITIAANIAKTAILTFDSCFPDSVVGFNSNESTNNIFIHFWFSFFQELLEEQAPESAQKNINLKILSELKVIVPPIELQQQFADFVAQTDKSKLAVKQILEKAETLKKSLMQEYFG